MEPLPVVPLLGLCPFELPLLPLLEPGEPGPVELESGAMPVPVVLSVLLLVASPSLVPVVSELFALVASFAGRSWLHAMSTQANAERNTAKRSRIILIPFVTHARK